MMMSDEIISDLADKAATDAMEKVMRTILLLDDKRDRMKVLVCVIGRLAVLGAGVAATLDGASRETSVRILEVFAANIVAASKGVLDDPDTMVAIREFIGR